MNGREKMVGSIRIYQNQLLTSHSVLSVGQSSALHNPILPTKRYLMQTFSSLPNRHLNDA